MFFGCKTFKQILMTLSRSNGFPVNFSGESPKPETYRGPAPAFQSPGLPFSLGATEVGTLSLEAAFCARFLDIS